MPRKSGKVTKAELEVCHRLKFFREWISLSQSELAAKILVARDLVAGVEYGRSPLKYGLACRIINSFNLNAEWVATGDGPMTSTQGVPVAEAIGVNKNELFSVVYRAKLQAQQRVYSSSAAEQIAKHGRIEVVSDAAGRLFAENWILPKLRDCLAAIPDSKLDGLVNGVEHFIVEYLENCELDPAEKINQRKAAIEIARVNLEQRRAYLKLASKDRIDNKRDADMVGDVKTEKSKVPTWVELKRDIIRLTAARGTKAALAKELKVSRQVLGNWLSDDAQGTPSAVLTLQLLHWVGQQERQK